MSLLTSAQSGKRIISSLQPKDDISMQLKELLTNDMLIALSPNLYKLATISGTKFLRHEINKE